MDLQAIEARLRDWDAGRNSELVEHAPEDMRALIAEVERLTAQIDALLTEVEQVRATIRVLTSERDGALSRNDSLIDAQEVVRRRIEEIHKPIDALNTSVNQIQQVCRGCGQDNGKWNEWPCPTIRALEAA